MLHNRFVAALAISLSAFGLAHAQTPASAAATAAPAAQMPAAPMAAPAPAPQAAPAAAAATSDAMEGKMAHYGRKFNGRKTASGERFNAGAMTMAHNTLAFGTRVKVTNLANKRSVVVRVNDRGPSTPGVIGDVTTAAARKLHMLRAGVVDVKLEVVSAPKARKGKA